MKEHLFPCRSVLMNLSNPGVKYVESTLMQKFSQRNIFASQSRQNFSHCRISANLTCKHSVYLRVVHFHKTTPLNYPRSS